ncbi:CidA/LrgA family protein [Humitalea sp. 24SJ18S-53]|uniref:CidA/LrgA family protein n=1 Tax=Humitalea sp. 24SJ18S-53 TaxID=3422307 RepID=UPI003D675E35
MIAGLTALLACQLAGEVLARAFALPVPGPAIGMVLLFAALLARRRPVPEGLGGVADGLLGNLGLLFVPAGVGVVLYLPLLAQQGVAIALAIAGGTLLALGITGLLAQALLRRFG